MWTLVRGTVPGGAEGWGDGSLSVHSIYLPKVIRRIFITNRYLIKVSTRTR